MSFTCSLSPHLHTKFKCQVQIMILEGPGQNVLIASSFPLVSLKVIDLQLKTFSLDSSGFGFLRANSVGRRDEQCSTDCAMASMVHLSSGRACSSRVNGPCLVRVSSSTLAQEDNSTATKS